MMKILMKNLMKMIRKPKNRRALDLSLKKHKISFRFGVLVLAAVCVLFVSHPALAESHEAAEDDAWAPKFKRLKRGGHNTVLGWVELPMGVRDIGEEHGFGAAATWGVLHGLGRAVQRTAAGVFEIITFPFNLNEDKPLIEPEYILE